MGFLSGSVLIMGKHKKERGTSRCVLLRSAMLSLFAGFLSYVEFEKNNNEETKAGNAAFVFLDGFDKGNLFYSSVRCRGTVSLCGHNPRTTALL